MKKSVKPRKTRVIHLTINVFYHSTEDPLKVRKAVLNILPKEVGEEAGFEEVVTEGHYGNRIGILTLKLTKKKAEKTLKHILCSLDRIDRQILMATLATRVGARPSHIYIRLSKQDAYLGKAELMDGDDVIKISATVNGIRNVEELKEFLKDLMGECGEDIH